MTTLNDIQNIRASSSFKALFVCELPFSRELVNPITMKQMYIFIANDKYYH